MENVRERNWRKMPWCYLNVLGLLMLIEWQRRRMTRPTDSWTAVSLPKHKHNITALQ